MKPVSVSSRAKVLNSLLQKARHRNVILESADGERLLLASISQWQGFDFGTSNSFAAEVAHTVRNKKFVKMMAARRAKDMGNPSLSIEHVRKGLGIERD